MVIVRLVETGIMIVPRGVINFFGVIIGGGQCVLLIIYVFHLSGRI